MVENNYDYLDVDFEENENLKGEKEKQVFIIKYSQSYFTNLVVFSNKWCPSFQAC